MIRIARDAQTKRLLGSLQFKLWPEDPNQIEYTYLSTDTDARKQGVATALMDDTATLFPHAAGILVHAFRRRTDTVDFYLKRGFQKIEPARWGQYWDSGFVDVPRRVAMIQLYKQLKSDQS